MHEHETNEHITPAKLLLLVPLRAFRWVGRGILRLVYPVFYGEPYDK